MRRWHRWLAVVIGALPLWISAIGVLGQLGSIVSNRLLKSDRPRSALATPPGFACPDTMMCRPKPATSQLWNVGLVHHLHSGESFGPGGTIVSLLFGLALFFAFPGLWMYIQMWRGRLVRTEPGKAVREGRFLW